MKLLFALLFASVCQAQTYFDATSNFGILTTIPGVSPYNIVDEFTLFDFSPSYTLGTTTITVSGQDGYGACSGRGCSPPFYTTTIDPPQLMIATVDPNGGPQIDVSPAVDVDGNPVTFTYTPVLIRGVYYDRWTLTALLPAGTTYNLHLTGTSCGGHGCQLPGASHLFVSSNPQYVYVPPVNPPGDD